MYQLLIVSHNALRWLVLLTLILAIYRSLKGVLFRMAYTKSDNTIRHWTATVVHLQLLLGMILYFKSPLIAYYWAQPNAKKLSFEFTFFSLIHSLFMLSAIVIITIGSAKAKSKATDIEKFKTMLFWFGFGLILILIAIPWPFSPFAHRPFLR